MQIPSTNAARLVERLVQRLVERLEERLVKRLKPVLSAADLVTPREPNDVHGRSSTDRLFSLILWSA